MALQYSLKPGEHLAIAVFDPVTKIPAWKTMHSSHPSFPSIVRALKKKDEKRALRLFDTAQLIADKTQGKVQVKKEGVYYNGTLVDNSLTKRILQIIKEGKPVAYMLRFMDNLYRNPQQFAINELYDWLAGSKLPITDDGRFTAYKRVRANYHDIRTNTIDNSPGQIVFMERSAVCKDRHNTCAAGLHFCSGPYIPQFGSDQHESDRVIQLAIDPADVVSIPTDYQFTKGRTWMYEVIKEVPKDQVRRLVESGVDIEDYQTAVYSIAKDSKKLRADIMQLNTIKSMLRKQARQKKVKRGRKSKNAPFLISKKSISKMNYGRLVNLYKQFAPPEPPTVVNNTFFNRETGLNRLFDIRESSGYSRGQVAQAMEGEVSYSMVWHYETREAVPQAIIDAYLAAIMKLTGVRDRARSGISIPKVKAAAAGAEPSGVDEFGYEVMEPF